MSAPRELHFQSASELARALREKRLSSRELTDLYLGRIARLNPKLNAVVTVDDAAARRRADEADAALRHGEVWGPLHGLPMTIKDTYETAGMRTTAGSTDLAEYIPSADATGVARLRGAGAIVIGKTNTPFMAGDVQSYNAVFGTTNNPWNLERTCGGSSGGAAAAVAAGLTALEFGSDIGGSIRTPANWCGVYGHKPTHGIVPLRGHIPGPPGTLSEPDLGIAGPLARSAEDLALALDVLAGPSADLAVGWRLELPPPRRASLRQYRIAAWLDDDAFPVDTEVKGSLRTLVDALRDAGAEVDESARPVADLAFLVDTYFRLLFPIILSGYPAEAFEQFVAMSGDLSEPAADPTSMVIRYGTARCRDWYRAHEARTRQRCALAEFFTRYDVLLCPVSPVPAIAHDHSEPMMMRTIEINGATRPYADLFSWISLATACLLPATVAPVARTSSGLPVGVQIVGPYLEDRTTIDFAQRVGELLGGFKPPPGW